MSEGALKDLLTNPYVLRCAWEKTRSWQSGAWQRDDREWAKWVNDPDGQIAALADQFMRSVVFEPKAGWQQIPFPKNEGNLRQHVRVPTTDEVAFMAYGVLLAPLLERRMWPFSFGGRWYRGMQKLPPAPTEDPHGPWRYRNLPYQLSDRPAFQSYARSYGMFRRVAHWTAMRMLDQPNRPSEVAGPRVVPDDFPASTLPYVQLPKGRLITSVQSCTGENNSIYYARLDLRAAYPSVKRDRLARSLESILREDGTDADRRLHFGLAGGDCHLPTKDVSPFRDPVWSTLEDKFDIRWALAKGLLESLQKVVINRGEVKEAWRPIWHSAPDCDVPLLMGDTHESHRYDDGLPTGCAISALLFNVYLHDLDTHMAKATGQLRPEQHKPPPPQVDGAYLRYVDDILILGTTPKRVIELVDAVFSWLRAADHADGQPDHNLYLSPNKVEPQILRCAIEHWSKTNVPPNGKKPHSKVCRPGPGWKEADSETATDLVTAWEHPSNLHQGQIRSDDLATFVTTLVEQMSDLGNPTLHDLFGHETGRRLRALHHLIREDLRDVEVRQDSRMAFAGRRIASAPLPEPRALPGAVIEDEARDTILEESTPLEEIGRSIRIAIQRAPGRFTLWDAVFRYAARCAAGGQPPTSWLRSLVQLTRTDGALARTAWDKLLGDDERTCVDRRSPSPAATVIQEPDHARQLAVSFLRANMLHALAGTLRSLERATVIDPLDQTTGWHPEHWAFPLMTREQGACAVDALHLLVDPVLACAYGTSEPTGLTFWEEEAIQNLRIATQSPRAALDNAAPDDVVRRLQRCRPDKRQVGRLLSTRLRDDRERLQWAGALGVVGAVSVEKLAAGIKASLVHLETSGSFNPSRDLLAVSAAVLMRLNNYHRLRHILLGIGHRLVANDRTDFARRLRDVARSFVPELAESESNRTLLDELSQEPPNDSWRQSPSARIKQASNGQPNANTGLQRASTPWERTAHAPNRPLPLTRTRTLLASWTPGGVDPGPSFLLPPTGNPPQAESGISAEDVVFHLPHAFPLLVCITVRNRANPDDARHRLLAHLGALVALTGSEHILDDLFSELPRGSALTYRLRLREIAPMPPAFWKITDNLLDWFAHGIHASDTSSDAAALRAWNPMPGPYTMVTHDITRSAAPESTDELTSDPIHNLVDRLTVRMAQVCGQAPFAEILSNWPMHPTPRAVLRDLTFAIPLPPVGAPRGGLPPLTVLPEVTFPPGAEQLLRRTCERYDIGVIVGRYWTPTPNLFPGPFAATRWFTNDALIVLPLDPVRRTGQTRTYVLRKPQPTIAEYALADALSARSGKRLGQVAWRLLAGDRLYRFVHPTWGNFAVGICSDLLDPSIWSALKGRVQHLFFIAHNEDVDLFHAMTRSRAFENYANLVLVNHGSKGGSYAWTPRGGKDKELARFNGENLRVICDIEVPVSSLVDAQRHQGKRSKESLTRWWQTPTEPGPSGFKTPPPTFQYFQEDDGE